MRKTPSIRAGYLGKGGTSPSLVQAALELLFAEGFVAVFILAHIPPCEGLDDSLENRPRDTSLSEGLVSFFPALDMALGAGGDDGREGWISASDRDDGGVTPEEGEELEVPSVISLSGDVGPWGTVGEEVGDSR